MRKYTCTCGRADENGVCKRCAERHRKATAQPKVPTHCEICAISLKTHLRCQACNVLVGDFHVSKELIGDLCMSCEIWRQHHVGLIQEKIPDLESWAETPDGFERSGFVVRQKQPKKQKEYCKQGHDLRVHGAVYGGQRICKVCDRLKSQRARERRKAAAR